MAETYTVSQVTSYLKGLITRDVLLRSLVVRGELSNVKHHTSGHVYFTLKDSGAALSGIMFASDAYALDIRLANGMKVEVAGSIGIYEKGGTYQIYAKKIRQEGRGELYERYLQLKEELQDMGMFADEYKQAIPEYISRLGVVTASTGAAVRDIINITRRRNPYVEIILYPARVQGEGAAESVAQGIEELDDADVDVIIAGRGGGSIEDLWAFNERIVAETIFNARTPVISAVGHETDTTIADFVADLRAPTPSAAAELAVYDYEEFLGRLGSYRADFLNQMGSRMMRDRLRIKEIESELKKKRPDVVIAGKRLRLAEIETKLREHMRLGIVSGKDRLAGYSVLGELITSRLGESKDRLSSCSRRMPDAMQGKIRDGRHSVAIYAERLKGVSPLEKLTMGYSYVTDDKGRNVRDAGRLSKGDAINIYMLHGKVGADVREIEKNEH